MSHYRHWNVELTVFYMIFRRKKKYILDSSKWISPHSMNFLCKYQELRSGFLRAICLISFREDTWCVLDAQLSIIDSSTHVLKSWLEKNIWFDLNIDQYLHFKYQNICLYIDINSCRNIDVKLRCQLNIRLHYNMAIHVKITSTSFKKH